MLKILWNALTLAQKRFISDLICADVFKIVKPCEVQQFIDKKVVQCEKKLENLQKETFLLFVTYALQDVKS